MQIALEVGDCNRRARQHRRAQAPKLQFLVAPKLGTVALAKRHHDAVGLRHVQIVLVDRQASIARHIVSPPDLARIERKHRRASLEARSEHIVSHHASRRVDIDQAVEFRAAVGRGQGRVPNRVAGIERHRHDLAVVKAANRHFFGDERCRRAT
jgi:hypothetical protein